MVSKLKQRWDAALDHLDVDTTRRALAVCYLGWFGVVAITLVQLFRFANLVEPATSLFYGVTFTNVAVLFLTPYVTVRYGLVAGVIEAGGVAVALAIQSQSTIAAITFTTDGKVFNTNYSNGAYLAISMALVLGNSRVFLTAVAARAVTSFVLMLTYPENIIRQDVSLEITCLIYVTFTGLLLCRLSDGRVASMQHKLESNAYLTSLLMHETRTPMQSIMSTAFELNQNDCNEKRRSELVKELNSHVDSFSAMQSVLDEYQDMEQSGGPQSTPQLIRVNSRLRDLVKAYTTPSHEKPISVEQPLWPERRYV